MGRKNVAFTDKNSGLDIRYRYVHSIWKAGDLATFEEIFRIIPMSVVAGDLHLNYDRFARKAADPGNFRYDEIENLSVLVKIPFGELAEMVVRAMTQKQSYTRHQDPEQTTTV